MKPLITVFTPTYNRAYTLHLCYESLTRQTNKNFIWLIIDDGSEDNTKELVESWIAEKKINIRYHYQENMGMHGAHNTAYDLIDTELNMCIDSDDYLTDDAIEKITNCWNNNCQSTHSGIIALDIDKKGKVIGNKLPNNISSIKLTHYYAKGGKGDKKLIYRTEVIKKYPKYPIFDNEKYFSLSYKYILIDQDYDLVILNHPVCVVEYMPDGSSRNMFRQYKNNPKGFMEFRKISMKYSLSLMEKFRQCIHYTSSSLLCKNKKFIVESPEKFLTVISLPFGLLLSLVIINYNKKKLL